MSLYCASCRSPHEDGLSPDGTCVICGSRLTDQLDRCPGCGGEFEPSALAADTGLCYGCEQQPEVAEQNACLAPVTSAQAHEVGSAVARASVRPLAAKNARRQMHRAALENGKEPQS